MSLAQPLRTIKNKLKVMSKQTRVAIVRNLLSYDAAELVNALRRVGVESGDSIMLHSAFELHHGFRGKLGELIDAFHSAVGPDGHLLMPSMAYHSSTLDYLTQLKRFDVRRTPSAMGLISECFRRRPATLRSIHPSHPILAAGPKAAWFVEGHERCLHSCGPGSPFDKLLEVGGKVVLFNVPFGYFTFFHYLEHHVSPHLGFPLYHEPPFEIPVTNAQGESLTVKTFAFGRETLQRRRFSIFETEMRRRGLIRRVRVGASTALLVDLRAVVAAVDDMTQQGLFFYNTTHKNTQ